MPTQLLFFIKKIIRNRNFMFLWGSQIFSQVSNNILNFSLALKIFQLTGSATSFSLLFVAVGLPAVIFGSFAGVICDRVNQKHILLLTNILRAALVPFFILVDRQLVYILLLVFLVSTIMQFFNPAETSLLPALVNKTGLVLANSLFTFTFYGAIVIGYLGSSIMVKYFGGSNFFVLYCVSSIGFLLAFVCNSLMHLPALGVKPIPTSAHRTSNYFHDFQQALLYIRHHALVYLLLQHLTIITGLFTAILVLAPPFARDVLNMVVEDVTMLIMLPVAVGISFVVPLIKKLTKMFGFVPLIQTGFLLSSILLVSFSLVQIFPNQLLFFLFLVFFLGMTNILVVVPSMTLLQQVTAPTMRGRIFGIMNMLLNITSSFPVVLVGLLVDSLGVVLVACLLGVAMLAYGLWGPRLHNRIQARTESPLVVPLH